MTTEEKIKQRLREAKQEMGCGELSITDYNKFVRHCRKLLTLLKKEGGLKSNS